MLNVWGLEDCIQGFCGIPLTEREYLEGLELEGRIILKRNFKKWNGYGLVWSGLL
jgi:hypothetical protein